MELIPVNTLGQLGQADHTGIISSLKIYNALPFIKKKLHDKRTKQDLILNKCKLKYTAN